VLHRRELADNSIEQRAEMFTMQAQDFDLKLGVHLDSSLAGDFASFLIEQTFQREM
jgi:hypothetical protein